MKKIIGSGVLHLKTAANQPGLKFGYRFSTDGIQLTVLGGDTGWLPLREAVNRSPLNAAAAVAGQGHLLLTALPASPHDAFYTVQFEAKKIGTNAESFSISVQEPGEFAHGPQSHFSNLKLIFQYDRAKGLSIAPGGTVSFHLHDTVFAPGKTLQLSPALDAASGNLVFTASAPIQLDAIGSLDQIRVELGSDYDRWAQLQALYTFDGGLADSDPGSSAEFATHDSSGQGAPSLYFDGKQNFKKKSYDAKWTKQGIAFTGSGKSILASSADDNSNAVVEAIKQSESFSVELWVKPAKPLQEGPACIFAIEKEPNRKDCFLLGQGPWTDGAYKKEPKSPAGDYLNASYGNSKKDAIPLLKDPYSLQPFLSPAGSLKEALTQVVYTYDQKGTTQRLYVNGVQVAEKFNPGDYNNWQEQWRLAVGNALDTKIGQTTIDYKDKEDKKDKPWAGEVHRLAIYNRALDAAEVARHYRPVLTITGEFRFADEVLNAPFKGEFFPFNLNIGQETATLTAARPVDFDINPGLGFRHVYLECTKRPDSAWAFTGTFLTRFWHDVVPLQAGLKKVNGTTALELSSGLNPERPADPLVLENALPGERVLRLSGARLTLTTPVRLEGKWLNQDMAFTSDAQYSWVWNHEQDYYTGRKSDGVLNIHLGASAADEPRIEDTLPRIFTTDLPSPGLRSSASSPILQITQSSTVCTLSLNLKGAKADGIRRAFDSLIAQAEDKGVKAGGLQLLRSRIAERLPLEYDSLLYYYYGWDVSKNYVDLHPGMQLRVDFQQYQFVHATEQRAKKGFVGSGSITVPVNSYTGDDGIAYLGFGPFLSRLQADKRGSLSEEGAGGLLDLVKVGSRKRYFRLFFPNESVSATAPERSVTIVGANSWKDLPAEMPLPGADNANQISFFFRDKAMVTPEIQVFVWNQAVYVPLGTTVRQLLERYANIPFASVAGPNLQAFLGRARPMRLIHTGTDNAPDYRFLHFGENSTENTRDVFDLPLVKGDRFYF